MYHIKDRKKYWYTVGQNIERFCLEWLLGYARMSLEAEIHHCACGLKSVNESMAKLVFLTATTGAEVSVPKDHMTSLEQS